MTVEELIIELQAFPIQNADVVISIPGNRDLWKDITQVKWGDQIYCHLAGEDGE